MSASSSASRWSGCSARSSSRSYVAIASTSASASLSAPASAAALSARFACGQLVVGKARHHLLPPLHALPGIRLGERPEMPCTTLGRVGGDGARGEPLDHLGAPAGEPVRVREDHQRAGILRLLRDHLLVHGTGDLGMVAVRLDGDDRAHRPSRRRRARRAAASSSPMLACDRYSATAAPSAAFRSEGGAVIMTSNLAATGCQPAAVPRPGGATAAVHQDGGPMTTGARGEQEEREAPLLALLGLEPSLAGGIRAALDLWLPSADVTVLAEPSMRRWMPATAVIVGPRSTGGTAVGRAASPQGERLCGPGAAAHRGSRPRRPRTTRARLRSLDGTWRARRRGRRAGSRRSHRSVDGPCGCRAAERGTAGGVAAAGRRAAAHAPAAGSRRAGAWGCRTR